MTSSICQRTVPCPCTLVDASVRLPKEAVSGRPGEDLKSARVGVTEQEAPLSMTMGSSLGRDERYMVGDDSGSDSW